MLPAADYLLSVQLLAFIPFRLMAAASANPEDWVSGSPFSHFADVDADTFTSAYLNVTVWTDRGWKSDKTEVGRYGGGYVGAAFGELVHVSSPSDASDHSGCRPPLESSRSDRRLPALGRPWIALVRRGRCNFEVKVENAFRARAAAVIVYNDRDSASLDKMKISNEPGRNVSAIFIYKWKGEELVKALQNDSTVYVHITIAAHTSSRQANINRTSVLFVSITFIVLMVISLTWLVFYYVQRFRYIRTKDKISRRLGNAAKKALSKIPTKNLKCEDKEMQGDCECCAICIEPYKISDTLRILPCGHEFHKSCIDPWLLEHRTCPMCKMDILRHYGFVFTGSQESILQVDAEIGTPDALRSQSTSPRILGGISPLPEIRAVILAERQIPRFFDNPHQDTSDSSRASTPDEMTPSLARRPPGGRQELCANCKAAAIQAEVLQNDKEPSTSTEHQTTDKNKDKQSSRTGGEVTKDT